MHRFGLFRPKSARRSLKFLRTAQKYDPEDPPFGPAEDQSCFLLASTQILSYTSDILSEDSPNKFRKSENVPNEVSIKSIKK